MALERIVFHCTDRDLFDPFIRGLPHRVLTEPLRGNETLKTRYFRGYRISKDRPDATAIAGAYYKEINVERNEQLLYHLCHNWLQTHQALAQQTFTALDLQDIDLQRTKDWLGTVHAKLSKHGHIELGREVARVLAFDHKLQDILTIVSILSVEYEDQTALRKELEREFQAVHDDPQVLHRALSSQVENLTNDLKALEDKEASDYNASQSEIQRLQTELKDLDAKREGIAKLLVTADTVLSKAKNDLKRIQKEHDAAKAAVAEATSSRRTVDRSISRVDARLKEREALAMESAGRFKTETDAVRRRLTEASKRLEETNQRISQRQVEKPTAASRPPKPAQDQPTYTLPDVLAWVVDPTFMSSSTTLSVLTGALKGELPQEEPQSRGARTSHKEEWLHYAWMAACGEPRWGSSNLCHYALHRSSHRPETSDETLLDLVVGGLYHETRVNDESILDRLLVRWLQTLTNGGGSTEQYMDPADALERFDYESVSSVDLEKFGYAQRKLATANSRALRRLYGAMPLHVRVVAKRALVRHAPSLNLQESDPTHEVLDLVVSHLETILRPMANFVDGLRPGASRQDDFRQRRQHLLAASAKLRHLFSPTTNARVLQFRDLLSTHLTAALTQATLDSYNRFREMLFGYCQMEFDRPEWISSRYLFPIVVALAQAASQAGDRIRSQRAEPVAVLEKRQHPLTEARQDVPLRVSYKNEGEAAAIDLVAELEADRKEVTITRGEHRIAKLGAGDSTSHESSMTIAKSVSAVEVTCLFRWREVSGEEKLQDQTLKLTAQHDVDWSQAGANPYTLRSITSLERLVGRDGDLETLRIGVEGTQSFCITGQKRVGKTSVARVLAEMFRDGRGFVSVYQTLGDCITGSGVGLAHSLYGAILDEVAACGGLTMDVELPTLEAFSEDYARQNRTFRAALERALGDRKVLCVVDDFDEIGEHLYRGTDADYLFLWLRGLIDRGRFSFVLVGSERLPEVLRHQGERLNQVRQHSLNYLRDVSAFRRLVAEPCRPHLEFSDEAVDVVRMHSAGNPYYATQICSGVYDDMYTRRDHYVAKGDVERCVDTICRESSVNNFQHLWTDGVFDRGADTARTQYLNAAIQMVCASAERRDGDGTEREVVVRDASLRKDDPDEVRFRLDNLIDRGVILETGGRISLRVPLFRRWLLTGGEAAVRSSFGEEDLEKRLAPAQVRPSPREVVEIARDIIYDGRQLSEDSIRTWLQQFGGTKNQELAFVLLKRLVKKGYFDEARIQTACKIMHRVILEEFAEQRGFRQKVERRRTSNVFIASWDPRGKSGTDILYKYRSANGLPRAKVGDSGDAVEFAERAIKNGGHCGVVFVDDFVGTGGSGTEGLRKFDMMLRERIGEQRSAVVVGVAAVVGFEDGLEALRGCLDAECPVVAATELTSEDRAFDPKAGIFENENDRVAAEQMCAGIGRKLEPDQPLGYGSCQALIVFSYRCPNNTLPIFYKVGKEYRGREWHPLFGR